MILQPAKRLQVGQTVRIAHTSAEDTWTIQRVRIDLGGSQIFLYLHEEGTGLNWVVCLVAEALVEVVVRFIPGAPPS